MSPADFDAALKTAPPGEQLCYAKGLTLKDNPKARHALAAYFRGEAELVQRRANGGFDYLAEKRSNLRPPLVPLALEPLAGALLKEHP